MKWHLLLLGVWLTCHVITPLCVASAGFLVVAILTGNLFVAGPVGLLSWLVAWGVARHYTLFAIGPLFNHPDQPASARCLVRHALRLFLLLMIAPAVVLVVGVVLEPMTPFSRIIAILAGIPAHIVVGFLLNVGADLWTWRVRRGRVFCSAEEVARKIASHAKRRNLAPADYVMWAGRLVPRDLMGAHSKLLGMTGSGKTVSLRQMLQRIVQFATPGSNRQVVVFDPKRELYSYILGMGPQVPVILFDGTDERGFAWDIGTDITEPNHAKAAARLFVPEEQSSQPYFARAARRILECVIRHLIDNACRWNLQDVLMILDDVDVLERVLPDAILWKYFKPAITLKNTLSTLDTLTSRFETLAASWQKAEREGRTLSLIDFAAASTSAILVIPRRLDIADAVDPTIRLIFERLIHLWLARPDVRFLPPQLRPDTHVILDETAKAGKLTNLDDLLLMGRAKGVCVTLAAQDIEAMRHEYGQKVADSLLAQCANTAVFALDSPETREYCANLFGSCEVWHRPRTSKASNISAALSLEAKDLYQQLQLREYKTLHPSDPLTLPRAKDSGLISAYFITDGIGTHYESYVFAKTLLPPANVPVLVPRDAADQKMPECLTEADLKRLGIPDGQLDSVRGRPRRHGSQSLPSGSTDSLRFIRRLRPRRNPGLCGTTAEATCGQQPTAGSADHDRQ